MSDSVIGKPTPLREGRAKVTGAVHFLPDLHAPGMLYARFVTSLYAHARLRAVHMDSALAVPGVVAVLTARDLPDIEPIGRDRLLLARDRVLFGGHPIALVLAESEAAAGDGAARVTVDYEPLAAAMTIEEALADNAPLVWPGGVPGASDDAAAAHGADVGGEESQTQKSGNVADRVAYSRGDIAAGFADADMVVERTFTTPAVHQSYLEPQACLVQPDPQTGGATVWTSTQGPLAVRKSVAEVLGVPESDVRVIATPVGGAFGGKFVLYEALVALAARVVGRPVRLVLTRMDEMISANPAPGMRVRVRLGAKRDGSFMALEGDLIVDSGCYPFSVLGLAAMLLGSLYRFPHLDIHGIGVLTFKPSAGAYRAPTATTVAFAIESVIDEVARALARDPIELRLQNAAGPGDPRVTGKPWPSMGMREVLEAMRAHPAWQGREAARAAGRGVGIAIGGWPGGTEPAAAVCALNRDGTLHVHLGTVDLTGTMTTFALLAADAFGIAPEAVRVVTGDTATAPFAGSAGGSKITYTVGPAVLQAAREARAQTLAIAAEEFEADPDDLEIVDGKVRVRGMPERAIALGDVAAKAMMFGGKYAPVLGYGRHADTTQAPGFCAQLAEVELDRETGEIIVHRLVVVQDVGRAINPLAIEGQMMGGAVQGLGWALYEAMAYDEHGQLLTGSWMDYAVPHIGQAARRIETAIVEVPSDHGPLGARGVGEPPVIATAAAVANALADAAGIRLTDLPMTPPRVLAALSDKGVAPT